jgi:dienelactone hydrolase
MKTLAFLLSLCCVWPLAQAAVRGEEVSYEADGVPLKGYLAYDDAVNVRRPGVLVVHEWWGQNEYARRRARMLAELGYTALAVDMYGNGLTADNPQDARKLASEVAGDFRKEQGRFEAGLTFLRNQDTVDRSQIAAFGYCFGGGVVLNMARAGEDLKAVVSFHGLLDTTIPREPRTIRAEIVSFSGDADPMIGPDKIAAFRTEMDRAGARYRLVVFPGAKHAFTNPDADMLGRKFNMPVAYDAQADKESWQQATELLRHVFGRR